jgi:hypothetical protein
MLTDAQPALVAGMRAISVVGAEDGLPPSYYHTHEDTPDKVDDAAMQRAIDFTVQLVRQVDRDAARMTAS